MRKGCSEINELDNIIKTITWDRMVHDKLLRTMIGVCLIWEIGGHVVMSLQGYNVPRHPTN